jgi:hypothetical protein
MHQYHLKKFQSKDNTSVRSYKINFSSSASMLKVRSRTSLISFCNHAKYKKMLVMNMQITFFIFRYVDRVESKPKIALASSSHFKFLK